MRGGRTGAGSRAAYRADRIPRVTIAHLRFDVVLLPRERAKQPRLSHFPVALDRLWRDSQDLRGFLDTQSAEVTQLHHAAFAGIDLGQRLECLVQCQYSDPAGPRDRSTGTGRGTRVVVQDRCPQRPRGGVALLRRIECRGNRGGPGNLARDGQARLENGQGAVVRRSDWGARPHQLVTGGTREQADKLKRSLARRHHGWHAWPVKRPPAGSAWIVGHSESGAGNASGHRPIASNRLL